MFNKINKIIHHPITHIIMIDLLFTMFFAALVYVISETVLPGIVTHILQPYGVFGMIFLFFWSTTIVNKKHAHTYHHAKIPLITLIVSMLIFCAIMAVANYRFGTLLNGIMTLLSLCTAYAVFFTLDATQHR